MPATVLWGWKSKTSSDIAKCPLSCPWLRTSDCGPLDSRSTWKLVSHAHSQALSQTFRVRYSKSEPSNLFQEAFWMILVLTQAWESMLKAWPGDDPAATAFHPSVSPFKIQKSWKQVSPLSRLTCRHLSGMKKQLPKEGPWTEKEAIHQKLGVEATVSRRWREELPADPPLEPYPSYHGQYCGAPGWPPMVPGDH